MGNNIRKLKSSDEIKQYVSPNSHFTAIIAVSPPRRLDARTSASHGGSFAVVKRAVSRKTGEEFAIKIIKKAKLNADELATVHDEVEIMHKINHPHCIQLVEMFESKKKIWMVMDLLTGGELFDRIVSKGSYSEREASDVVRSVASALEYLHSIGITHRDLKPENLLYKSPEANSKIVLTDFGLAKYKSLKELQTQGMKTACGTPGYVSPEIVMNVHYTTKTDLWSLGVIAYILLCGFPPFYSESTHQLYQQIKAGDYSFPSPYWTDISSSAKDLIRHLLCVDPLKRYSATDVLRHPWVGGENVSTKALCSGYSKRLIALQCRRRLRRGVKVLLAINRFTSALQDEQSAAAAAAVGTVSSGGGQAVQPMEVDRVVPIGPGAGVGQSGSSDIIITDASGGEVHGVVANASSGVAQLGMESTTLQPVVLSTS